LADHVSAVSEANGTTVPVSLDLRSSLSIQPLERKPLAGAADAECYGNSIDFCLKSLAGQGLWAKRLLFMLIDVERLVPKLRHPTCGAIRFFKKQFRCLCLYTRQRPPRERLRCVLGMFSN
jgi:hypothetical protein